MTDKQQEPVILACPFCGSQSKLSYGNDGETVNVRCVNWGNNCLGAGANCRDNKDAITAWNTRTPSPNAKASRVATLMEAVKACDFSTKTFSDDSGEYLGALYCESRIQDLITEDNKDALFNLMIEVASQAIRWHGIEADDTEKMAKAIVDRVLESK